MEIDEPPTSKNRECGAKDTQLSLIFSDIDDVISFSNLLFICAQFANIFVKLSEAGECKNEDWKTFQ